MENTSLLHETPKTTKNQEKSRAVEDLIVFAGLRRTAA
jgi:hypothetical protein